ncbi:MAG: tail fiber domain-containing protein [Pyrinomonadaceae bacterium]
MGSNNAFFGRSAGLANTVSDNSFFGANAGDSNTNGARNSFFGRSAGGANVSGADNAFFGHQAGLNTIAGFNSFFGSGSGTLNTTGIGNAFFGREAGDENTTGSNNAFFGANAGAANTSGGDNTFVGRAAGGSNTIGSSNTYIGAYAGGNPGITNAAAIGANAFAFANNQIVIGTNTNVIFVPNILDTATLKVSLLSGGGDTPLCRNASREVAFCSSSMRYKTNIASFNSGLSLVDRLRPITFDWKDGGMRDLGLGAEDVAAVEPLLVHYNKDGQVEGVKYDRLGVVLLNAIREQQTQIQKQQTQIEMLKRLVCGANAQAEVCKEK